MARISIRDVDGIRLKSFIFAGSKWLSHHRSYLDKINFFPVPDGDTGANMYLTLTAVCAQLRSAKKSSSAGDVAKEAAMGALMGSKGNSGIILAQYLRGFSDGIGGKRVIRAHDIAKALALAAKTAKEGVLNPREGTILSVARDGASGCVKNLKKQSEIINVLTDYYRSAGVSLAKTRTTLTENRKANVVDAGGKGLLLLFEGMLRLATGKSVKNLPETGLTAETPARLKLKIVKHRYCTSFILKKKQKVSDTAVKTALKKYGESIIMDKGIKNVSKIHMHTNIPDKLLEKASELGLVENVNIDDMKKQVENR
jgi:dihydroxyacetone kinase-like predicted kinase